MYKFPCNDICICNPLFNLFYSLINANRHPIFWEKKIKTTVKLLSLINFVNSSKSLTVYFFSVLCIVLVVAAVVVIAFSVWEQPRNLVSISGFIFFLFILLICSAHPTKVSLWRRHLVHAHGYPLIHTTNVNVQSGAVWLFKLYIRGSHKKFESTVWRLNAKFHSGELASCVWWPGPAVLLCGHDSEVGCWPSGVWIPGEPGPNLPGIYQHRDQVCVRRQVHGSSICHGGM